MEWKVLRRCAARFWLSVGISRLYLFRRRAKWALAPRPKNCCRGISRSEFVGMHTLSPTRHWPDLPFGSIRPAGTSWGALEPSKGQYDWYSLDTWVSQTQAHQVQLDYVFVNTPRWASTRPDEPCPGNRFGCAAPPNPNDFSEFVTTLVTRYKWERYRVMSYGTSPTVQDFGPVPRRIWRSSLHVRIRSSNRSIHRLL